jgi:hypothetical protein
MPLWAANLVMAFFTIAALATGIWLFLHIDAIARLFAGKGDMVAAPGPRSASRGKTLLVLVLFNLAWIACVLIWIYLIGGEANEVVDASI